MRSVLLIGLPALLLLWLGGWFAERLLDNRRWIADPAIAEASALDEIFFNRLRDAGLLWVEAPSPRRIAVRYASCENAVQPIPAELPADVDPKQLDALLPLLCRTGTGEAIRREIDQWNDSFELVAIRDNRVAGDPASERGTVLCRDGRTPIGLYVAPGCLPTGWTAKLIQGATPVDAPAEPDAVPPYGDFAFIAEDRHLWQSDWFRPRAGEGPPNAAGTFYRFRTAMTLGRAPVVVDLVGRPLRIALDGRASVLGAAPAALPQKIQLGSDTVELEILCREPHEAAFAPRCRTWPADDVPYAVALTVSGPPGRAVDIEIDALPVFAASKDLTHRTQHIEICERGDARPACRSAAAPRRISAGYTLGAWRSPPTILHRSGDAGYRLVARDGVTDLVRPDTGLITDQALALGLAPVVGLGPTDVTSLAATLDALPHGDGDIWRLTIDPAWQKLSADAIEQNGRCRDRIVPTGKSRTEPLCDRHDHRVAVVLMDAGNDPARRGEILATASWPNIEPGLATWDLAALDAGAPAHSPISGMAWRAVDVGATPGSSFKGVTSLAAIDAALGANDGMLGDLLLGRLKPDRAGRLLHLAAEAGDAPPGRPTCIARNGEQPAVIAFDDDPKDPNKFGWLPVRDRAGDSFVCLGNAGEKVREPFVDALLAPQKSGCAAAGAPRLGLCEALITSSNLFFGGLAQLIDGPAVLRPDGTERLEELPDLAVARMARRLFPDNGAAAGNRPVPAFDLLRGQLGRSVPRLLADPIVVKAARSGSLADGRPDPNVARRIEVAESGYGQAVQATTLAMATTYAGIATEHLVRPRLVPLDPARPDRVQDPAEGKSLLDVPPDKQALYRQLMGQLRRGLAGVVEPLGTAKDAFASSRLLRKTGAEVLFAKTGTAIVGATEDGKALYSAWLVGWLEPAAGDERRIAFACTVTPTVKFGADACGPIMRQILEHLPRAP